MKPHPIRLLFLLLTAAVAAQDGPASHTLTILPLGDPPPFRQEVRQGVRYEIPAAEGTIPPRRLEIAIAPEDSRPARLRLGMISAPLEFPLPESRVVEARQAATSWIKIPLSTANASLALIWRGGPDWSKAGVLTIPDSRSERHRGDFRFINVTAKPMGIVWGGDRLKLEPRTTLTRSLPAGSAEVELSVLFPAADGSLRPCLATKVARKADKLQQFIIYAADGVRPRMPVKVLPLEVDR